jgi:hypothetical protein
MSDSELGVDRRLQLGFEEAVLGSFEFLLPYGLKPVERNATFVRYESKQLFVNVYHGRASFEIGVEIGSRNHTLKYQLSYIVHLAGTSAWEAEGFGRVTMFQVSSREGVQRFVPKVAELLKKYGNPFFQGDAAFYDGLEEADRLASVEYTRRQRLEGVRKKANAAWSEKDLPRVAELYRTMRDQLTEIETKRLAYAEKKPWRSSG